MLASNFSCGFRIGAATVGSGHPPFFIAEMSGNHNQSLEIALEIVEQAAASGANAIKLQTYTPDTLTLESSRPEYFIRDDGSPWNNMRLWDLYEAAYTPWEWHEPIFRKARSLGLACISSAFDTGSVDFLESLGVDAIKIASFELIHLPLVRAAAAVGKPVIVSTGMASLAEIEETVALIRAQGNGRLALLKCTSAYPSRPGDANLATVPDLKSRFGCVVGISDHTMSEGVVAASVALGAAIVEKHFTLSRSAGGVDAGFSLEPAEFKAMTVGALDAFAAIGRVAYGAGPSEKASLWERPSVRAVAGIRKGAAFTPDNVRVIRPAGGLPPKAYDGLIGRRAALDIERGSPILESSVSDEQATGK